MRKLKLESLQVESFETGPAARERGTMYAHQPPPKTYGDCGDTEYLDCTYGCSEISTCCTELSQGLECQETSVDC